MFNIQWQYNGLNTRMYWKNQLGIDKSILGIPKKRDECWTSLHHSVPCNGTRHGYCFPIRFPLLPGSLVGHPFASRSLVRNFRCSKNLKKFTFSNLKLPSVYLVMFGSDVRCGRLCSCEQPKKSFAEKQNRVYTVWSSFIFI